MHRAFFNWSGGKDSALALHHALLHHEWDVQRLVTTVTEGSRRITMHGVREVLLEQQAASLGIPLVMCSLPAEASMQMYERRMSEVVENLASEGFSTALFGDIFLEDLRAYREEQLARNGVHAAFPLWKRDPFELLHEFVDLGFKAIVVCVNEQRLDRSFAGRLIDADFISDYPRAADICGENGEYHSFVFDGPIFRQPIRFEVGETIERGYSSPSSALDDSTDSSLPQRWDTRFWYTDLLPLAHAEAGNRGDA